jgi:glycosyltransferase involved in cell wall biosynthesis
MGTNKRANRKPKILLIHCLFAELYISGLGNRFVGFWIYLQKHKELNELADVHLLTNRSLWQKYFPNTRPPGNVTVIKASLKYFKFTSRLYYPFYIIYVYFKTRSTSIHIANSIVQPRFFIWLLNLLNIPYCFTFASNSVDMASYNNKKRKRYYTKLLSSIKNLDILNPTHNLQGFRAKKFISPTSFPYILDLKNIPVDKYTNPVRFDTVVFCGSFIKQKNPDLAIEGFYHFLKENNSSSNAQLVLIGKGEMLDTLQQRANSINEEVGRPAILFAKEHELMDILSKSKIFLSLQDYDNYPSQSVMEAMLFCNAVISIDNGDTRKLIVEGNGNSLLTEKDPLQLANAIKDLFFDWRLNVNNREHILQKFSAGEYAAYFFDIHRTLMK